MKELKDIVVSLDLAKELKENGFKQESLFVWIDFGDGFVVKEMLPSMPTFGENFEYYSAPIATELLNELPEVIVVKNKVHSFWCNKIDGLYRCGYDENCLEEYGFQEDDKSMANAMAKLYLELKKEGLL